MTGAGVLLQLASMTEGGTLNAEAAWVKDEHQGNTLCSVWGGIGIRAEVRETEEIRMSAPSTTEKC